MFKIEAMQEILSNKDIEQKINRIAHELIEHGYDENRIVIGGIQGNGFTIAQKIHAILENQLQRPIALFEVTLNKDEPWSDSVFLSLPIEDLKNGYIVLVDDVINSGKTLQFALAELLRFPSKAIKIVTLIDRTHRRYPVKADFVGLSLSTTLKAHVEVVINESEMKAFLV